MLLLEVETRVFIQIFLAFGSFSNLISGLVVVMSGSDTSYLVQSFFIGDNVSGVTLNLGFFY